MRTGKAVPLEKCSLKHCWNDERLEMTQMSIIHALIHSTNIYCVPGNVLCARDISLKKINKGSCLLF